MNDLSPGPFSERRGDHGSLRSQAERGSALGRPGGRPMNDLSPGPFSERRGDQGSLHSQAKRGSASGRPGGRPMNDFPAQANVGGRP